MAHLFLAGKLTMSEDVHAKGAPKTPKTPSPAEKLAGDKPRADGCVVARTAAPLINEAHLTAATGGAEVSCYRCTVPFGVVVLVAGVVVTAVAYAFNSHGSTISVLGLALLSTGLGLLASSAVCWRVRVRRKRRDKRRESQTALMAQHGAFVA